MQEHGGVKGEGTFGEVQVVLYCWGWGGKGARVRWRALRVMVMDFLKALGFQAGDRPGLMWVSGSKEMLIIPSAR